MPTATVESSAAVKTATAVKAAGVTMESTVAVERRAPSATETATTYESAARAIKSATTVITASAIEPTSIIEAGAAIEAVRVIAVEPGTGANEDAANEPVGAVVAIWCAGVRRVAIVTISAVLEGVTAVNRSYSNANPKPNLSVRRNGDRKCGKSQ